MAKVTGKWSITTDWGCDGSITGTFEQTFKSNGTWKSSPWVHSGRWIQVGDHVIWTFKDVKDLVYSGNISGSWMTGAQGYTKKGSYRGCFGARRSGVPMAKVPAKAKSKADPAIG